MLHMRLDSIFLLLLMSLTVEIYAQQGEPSYVVSEIELDDRKNYESTYLLVKVKEKSWASFPGVYAKSIVRRIDAKTYLVFDPESQMFHELDRAFRVDNSWKLASELNFHRDKSRTSEYYIHSKQFHETIRKLRLIDDFEIKGVYETFNLIQIRTTSHHLSELASWPDIDFIQRQHFAEEEANTLSHDLSPNMINWVHHNYRDLTGRGIALALKERAFNKEDIDLWPRGIASPFEDKEQSIHATAMASIAVGAGNTSKLSRGVAFGSSLISSSFERVLPDDDEYFVNNGLSIQNHSYGVEINNSYDAIASAYDLQTHANRKLLHIFSSGNSGFVIPEDGQYAGLGTYSNITGGLKMAKNILTVGAVDELGRVDERSSRGPAYDGRIKPDMVAYGKGGTSEAAALVSGTSVLLKQAYEDLNLRTPESALLKAVLIAGAKPLKSQKVSYESGFGKLNAKRSLQLIEASQMISGDLTPNTSRMHQVSIPANTKSLRVVLVWNDPAANPGDFKALVNDLDMTIAYSAQSWQPWVLDPTPDLDKLSLPPTRKTDTLNNVELITIDDPVSGDYTILVSSEALVGGDQEYHIAYYFDKADTFEWTFPTGSDVLNSNEVETLRFENNFDNEGSVAIKYGNDDWLELGAIDNLGFFQFTVADTSVISQLRATFEGQVFLSDRFVVSPNPVIEKELACGNDFLMSWLSIENAEKYRVSRINEEGVLEQVLETSDTAVFLNRQVTKWNFDVLSVYAIIDGQPAEQAQVYNFNSDGIGCYFNTFTASVTNEKVDLSLGLSTTYNVDGINFERWDGNDFVSINNQNFNSAASFNFTDSHSHSGYFIYRASVRLLEPMNGLNVSSTESIELAVILPESIALFPNPLRQGDDLNLLSDSDEVKWLMLIDSQGNRVKVIEVNSQTDSFTIEGLNSGLYLYQLVSEENRILKTGRLIIR